MNAVYRDLFRIFACAAIIAVAAPVGAQEREEDDDIPEEVAVRLRPGVDVYEFIARYSEFEDEEEAIQLAIPSRGIYVLKIEDDRTKKDFVEKKLRPDPDTIWADQEYGANAPEGTGQNFFCRPVNNNARYLTQPMLKQINAIAAQEESTGAGVLVAIVDSGIDATHEALAGRVRSDGWNFQEDNNDTRDIGDGKDNDDDDLIDELTGHGTHIAGLVALIAPDAQLLPVKILDSDGHTTDMMIAAGIYYAIDKGAQIINVSLGSTYPADAVEDALAEARAAGIVVIAAAGNLNREVPEEYPAMFADALGVAAVDERDKRWEDGEGVDGSNYNVDLAISAPGVAISSTIPDNMYAEMDGSSMATALVSGTAALLLAKHPDWPADSTRFDKVVAHLRNGAVSIDALNPEYAGKLGAGRVDALATLGRGVSFDRPVDYGVGALPAGVIAADLNGDGAVDIATADEGADTVSVLLNRGNGTFAHRAGVYPVGGGPIAIVAADLDGVRGIDLAVMNSDSAGLSILLNNGDGTFAAARTYAGGGDPQGLAAGDLDGDNDVDLITADDNSDSVIIFENLGDGVFVVLGKVPVGNRPADLIVERLNDDAFLDIATVNRGSSDLTVLLGRGDGTFAAAVHFGGLDEPRSLAAGDFDQDDDLDIVIANHDSRDLAILFNDANAGFAIDGRFTLNGLRRPDGVIVADMNCDGMPDLIVFSSDQTVGYVDLLPNDGAGVFGADFSYTVGASPSGIAAARLDDDDGTDLIVANAGDGDVSVLLNQTCAYYPPGDLNCDGSLDLVDVGPFITALLDRGLYEDRYPDCDIDLADLNRDGSVNLVDIEPFIEVLLDG